MTKTDTAATDTTTTDDGTTSPGCDVTVGAETTTVQRQAIVKLVQLHAQAQRLRSAMDFCAERCRLEDMLANGLNIEATMEYAKRAECSLMDAREYIARVLDRRARKGLASDPTILDTRH